MQQARWNEPEEQFGARDFFRTPERYGFVGFDWDLPGQNPVTGTVYRFHAGSSLCGIDR